MEKKEQHKPVHGMKQCRVCGCSTSRMERLCFEHTYTHPHLRSQSE